VLIFQAGVISGNNAFPDRVDIADFLFFIIHPVPESCCASAEEDAAVPVPGLKQKTEGREQKTETVLHDSHRPVKDRMAATITSGF